MITRRHILAVGAGGIAAGTARAEGWKDKYPQLVFAVIPGENATNVTDRYGDFAAYLTKELGVPVSLRVVQDYAGVIEAQRSGSAHIAYYGPAAFARARLIGVKTDAFVVDVGLNGVRGYYSVLWVKASSPYRSIEDLKGKILGLVDPNSASGNQVVRYTLSKLGIKTDSFFSKVVYTGSHENALYALAQGTVDAAANVWATDTESNLALMVGKGLLKAPDGGVLKKEDFRIVLTSDLIINGPYAYLSELPADLKAAIRKAFAEAPDKAKEAYGKIAAGRFGPWQEVTNGAYDSTIELIKYVDSLRKS